MDTHHHVHSLGGGLRLAKKVIAGDPTKHLVSSRLVIIKQRVDAALLAKIGQRPEETGFTQVDAVTLAIMLRAVPPEGLQGAKLLAVARYTRVTAAHRAMNNIGLTRLIHHDHSWRLRQEGRPAI
jgi:hypothetical protein